MTIWVIFLVLTAAAVAAVLWPLAQRAAPLAAPAIDADFYRAQLDEIARDAARGLIAPDEAEAARAEAARRLLRAAGDAAPQIAQDEPALRRRRAASAIAISTIPLVAVMLYGALGRPALPDRPLAGRIAADPQQMDMAEAISRVENHLATHPDDARGWAVLAPVYLRAGRGADAARAFENIIRIEGESPVRLADYGEALAMAAGGIVEAPARAAFQKALAGDPNLPKARFFMALAKEQDGDKAGALDELERLVADGPADAPWKPAVAQRIAELRGLSIGTASQPADVSTQIPAGQRDMIEGMVAGLASRLDAQGGTLDEWTRLIRSYAVLGHRDEARAALAKAKAALPADADKLDTLARELDVAEASKP
jgi:cytochrome c-type biogenesis protein CcmH